MRDSTGTRGIAVGLASGVPGREPGGSPMRRQRARPLVCIGVHSARSSSIGFIRASRRAGSQAAKLAASPWPCRRLKSSGRDFPPDRRQDCRPGRPRRAPPSWFRGQACAGARTCGVGSYRGERISKRPPRRGQPGYRAWVPRATMHRAFRRRSPGARKSAQPWSAALDPHHVRGPPPRLARVLS